MVVTSDLIFAKLRKNGVTVNGKMSHGDNGYFLWPQMEHIDLNGMFFQQNVATCHTSGETNHWFIGRKVLPNIN